ncbi:MAG: phosphoribosyltransferase [Desulfurococcaceae archaeon]
MDLSSIIYIPWSTALRYCYELAMKVLESNYMPQLIVAISRGGLIPARIVSDVLGVYELYAVRSTLYMHGKAIGSKPLINAHLPVELIKGRRVLIVDEVVDTGTTMVNTIDCLRKLDPFEVRTAVIHYKSSKSVYRPDYYIAELKEWKWIYYPWSLVETLWDILASNRGISVRDVVSALNMSEVYIEASSLEKCLKNYSGAK